VLSAEGLRQLLAERSGVVSAPLGGR